MRISVLTVACVTALGAGTAPPPAVRQTLTSADPRARSGAIEYLDNLVKGQVRTRVMVLIEEMPRVKILAISSHHDPWTMLQVQRIGIHGFVDKNDQRPEVLTEAIHAVLGGRVYFTPVVNQSSALIRRDPKSFIRVLSDYETRILSMIGESKSDDEIATVLGISPATVQSRRRDIMKKLDIHSTPKLIHYAIVNGLTRAEQLGRKKPT